MKKKVRKAEDGDGIGAKLDAVVRLLEDLFILQAISSGIRREHIRSMIGVHTTRISRINKGIKRARKDRGANNEAD